MPHRELNYVQAPVIYPVRRYMDLPETFITTDTRIELHTDTPETKIYFTSDGSEPDPFHRTPLSKQKTHKYKGPFSLLTGTRTVRAIAVTRNMRFQSHISTRTFIVRDNFHFGVDLNRPNDEGSVVSLVSETDSDLTIVSQDVDFSREEQRMLQQLRSSRDLENDYRSFRGHGHVREGWVEREPTEYLERPKSPGILRDGHYSERAGLGSSRVHFASYDSFQHAGPSSSRSLRTQRSSRSYDPSLDTGRLLDGYNDHLAFPRPRSGLSEKEIDEKLQALEIAKEMSELDKESDVKTETDFSPPALGTYRKGNAKENVNDDDATYIVSSDGETEKKKKSDKTVKKHSSKTDLKKEKEPKSSPKTKSQKGNKSKVKAKVEKGRERSSSESSSSSSSESAVSTNPSSAAAMTKKKHKRKSNGKEKKSASNNGVNYWDMSTEEVIQSVRMSSHPQQPPAYPGMVPSHPGMHMGHPQVVQAHIMGPPVYPQVFGGPVGVTYVQAMNSAPHNANNVNSHPPSRNRQNEAKGVPRSKDVTEPSSARSIDSSTVVSEAASVKSSARSASRSNGVPVVASRASKQKTALRNSRTASLQDFLGEEAATKDDTESEVSVAVPKKTQSYPIVPENEAENQLFDGFIGKAKKFFSGWGSNGDKKESDKPENATTVGRSGILDAKNLNYNQILGKCLKNRKLWEDAQFPANHQSLYLNEAGDNQVEWKRPHEISKNPQFLVGGASRLDVKQGVLGNCWLLAAVASLCADEEMFQTVVPVTQSFTENYCGAFRFLFWQYGKWVEVCVDDRLPTKNGKLMYMHSESQNEFWSPLLEKAYAKLCGCYEALTGGLASEAMTDFTGGVTERFNFKEEVPDNMFQIMSKAKQRNSLMGCSIDTKPDEMEARLENGLIKGHAYSITDINIIQTKKGPVQLVRIRNPWGDSSEWNGAWGDRSSEWQSVSEEEREKLGLEFQHDGEFWMSFKDFATHFQRVEVCNVVRDSAEEKWQATLIEGAWIKRVNAGGCRNHPGSYSKNPQYRVTVTDPDEDDEEEICTVIVGLIQKDRRKLKKQGKANLTIGFDIYDVSHHGGLDALDHSFFSSNGPVASAPQYINMREVCGRFRLPPGQYCIVPTTFEPNAEGEFLLRVYTEKDSDVTEIDSPTTKVAVSQNEANVQSAPITTALDSDMIGEAQNQFESRCGEDNQVDAYELQLILNETFTKGFNFGEFDINLCRSMVALRDVDHSGMLGFDEFKILWQELCRWKAIYKQYDADNSGHFSSFELREALKSVGYQTSNATFKAIVMRYSDRQGYIKFDDFVACIIKLKSMFDIHQLNTEDGNKASFELDKFIQMTMYS